MTLTAVEQSGPMPQAWGIALALILTAAATLAAVLMDRVLPIPNLSLVFVLPVVVMAATFGWRPALVAALGGVLAFNFFLIEPRHTLRVDDPANVWALALLLAVAAVVSAVAAESRRRAVDALLQARHSRALQGLAQALVAAADVPAAADAAAKALGQLFGAPAVVMLMQPDGLGLAAASGGAGLSDADLEAARWAAASKLATRGAAYPVEQARFDFWPVQTPSRLQAVIGLDLSDPDGRPDRPEDLVESVAGYLSLAMEREHFAAQALEARVRGEAQRLQADLLAAVSHDLKTPLSTILFTLQSLRKFGSEYDAATSDRLLSLAEAETGRLSALVANLLDMSRIDADAVTVRIEPVDLTDLVASAVERARAVLDGRPVELAVAPRPVRVDQALAQVALANVLDNAAKYSPPGSPIRVSSAIDGDMALLEVADDGPGFPEPVERLFGKFARGVEGDGRPPGTGLGLAITRAFVEAFGGRVRARNGPDGGAVVSLWLPLEPTA